MLSQPSTASHPSNPLSSSSPSHPAIFNSPTSKLAALHDSHSATQEDPNYTDPLTPSLVLNIFLSVLITGFAVYWALTFQMPDILVSKVSSTWRSSRQGSRGGGGGASEAVRVLVSIFAALGVGVAEVLIYAIYLGKIEQARGKEGRLRERKEVIGREEVGGRDQAIPVGAEDDDDDEKDEKDVIWGRGPNGGLRRRVREKWEETTKEQGQEQEQEQDQNQDHEKAG